MPIAEEAVLVAQCNAHKLHNAEAYPEDVCVHELFERQAERTPDAVAVRSGGEHLSYRELDGRAVRLARRLAALGAGPDAVVGVCLVRAVRLVEGVLGVLKSGAAYLPLDPEYPAERLGFMLRDARARVLVTESALRGMFADFDGIVVAIDESGAREETPLRATARDLAYVIYTSGSTGNPKGVSIEHRSLVNVLHTMAARMGLAAPETVLSIGSFTFDVTLPDWFWAFMTGGRVLLASQEELRNPRRLQRLIDEERPTHFQATPGMWETLLAAGVTWGPGIRLVTTGEHVGNALRAELRARAARVWNLYGPTETTVWSCACELHADRSPDSIGGAIGNTDLFILDEERLEPVPDGELGELFIGGHGLARGYLHNPGLTAERFIRPATLEGRRVYRTGDLVRRLPDGALEFHGRRDHQVKLRGFRIELGEIDAAARGCAALRACVSILREDRPGEKRIVLYAVAKPGASGAKPAELRAWLLRRLPEHMMPAAIMLLPELPLTPNGKVDRKALPRPEDAPAFADGFEEPATETERAVAALWRELLGVPRVGRRESFFELGGHSLLAVKMLGRLRRDFGWSLSYEEFVAASSLAALCARRASRRVGGGGLLQFRDRGEEEVVIFMHGHGFGTSATDWAPVAMNLPPSLAVWGLQGQGWDGGRIEARTRAEVAAGYAEEVRAAFAGRKVTLAGYCVGGALTVELAARLQAAGVPISRVVLVDSLSPSAHKAYAAEQAAERASARSDRSLAGWCLRIKSHARFLRRHHGRRTRGLLGALFAGAGLRVPVSWRNHYHARVQSGLFGDEPIRRFEGRVDLIQSRGGDGTPIPHGWEAHAREVAVVAEMPCEHKEMLDPKLAELIAAAIGRRHAFA